VKRICLYCERTSSDSNLFCQETYCPAEMAPYIFDYGEWLGDIEVTRPITVLRSSALYEARHNGQSVLLKVAHPGREHTERLKREVAILAGLASAKDREGLPRLLPPYANASVDKEAYGRAMYREHLLYYALFEHAQGDPLRDVLLKNPQLWVFHVGWIATSLARALALLQSKGHYHLGLTPESLLVRFPPESAAPEVLLIDLGVASTAEGLAQDWYPALVPPAYTAPELIDGPARPNYAGDVYGVGLILYELLVGSPAYPYKLRSEAEVYAAVRTGRPVWMSRVEDVRDVAALAVSAVSPDPAQRPKSAAELASQLLKLIGDAPAKRQRAPVRPRTALVVASVLLTLAFIITLGATFATLVR
jgi:serine/threonine protein kinase